MVKWPRVSVTQLIIDARLAEIAEQKARLTDDWVQLDMDANKYQDLSTKMGARA